MEINIIIIRDFDEMLVWWIYANKSNELVWEIWNEKFGEYDFDVLSFDNYNDLNEFLAGELPKM